MTCTSNNQQAERQLVDGFYGNYWGCARWTVDTSVDRHADTNSFVGSGARHVGGAAWPDWQALRHQAVLLQPAPERDRADIQRFSRLPPIAAEPLERALDGSALLFLKVERVIGP